MRLLHLSDLHLGKSLSNLNLIEEQSYALNQIERIIDSENIDIILIAGDIFDKSVASNEALLLFENFIETLTLKLKKKVVAISGNHDSSARIEFAKSFFEKSGCYLIGTYEPNKVITLFKEDEKINIYPIPFISLQKASTFLEHVEDYTDLYRQLLPEIDESEINILMTHCYASSNGDGEENYDDDQRPLSLGNSDIMNAALFEKFDYVALGHLHRAHYVHKKHIRYCGTFMKYSFSEARDNKSITIFDTLTKDIEIKPLELLHDLKVYNDYYKNIIEYPKNDDYVQIILKDKNIVENVFYKLKSIFKNLVNVKYEQLSESNTNLIHYKDDINKDLMTQFELFYDYKMNESMDKEQKELLLEIIGELNETC